MQSNTFTVKSKLGLLQVGLSAYAFCLRFVLSQRGLIP